jgi:hypothetical protein
MLRFGCTDAGTACTAAHWRHSLLRHRWRRTTQKLAGRSGKGSKAAIMPFRTRASAVPNPRVLRGPYEGMCRQAAKALRGSDRSLSATRLAVEARLSRSLSPSSTTDPGRARASWAWVLRCNRSSRSRKSHAPAPGTACTGAHAPGPLEIACASKCAPASWCRRVRSPRFRRFLPAPRIPLSLRWSPASVRASKRPLGRFPPQRQPPGRTKVRRLCLGHHHPQLTPIPRSLSYRSTGLGA